MRRFPGHARWDADEPAWRQRLSDSSDLLGIGVSDHSDLLGSQYRTTLTFWSPGVSVISDLSDPQVPVISDLLPSILSDSSDLLGLEISDYSDLSGVGVSVISDLFSRNERPARAEQRRLMMIHQCS